MVDGERLLILDEDEINAATSLPLPPLLPSSLLIQ
jgi:hypothetical protein